MMVMEPPPPNPETFGLTMEDVGRAPCVYTVVHRRGLLVAVYGLVALVVFLAIAVSTGSLATAIYLTAVMVAAGSILLVPLLVCAIGLGERAELAWLCRRFPKIRSMVAYQRALERHHESAQERRARRALDWRSVDRLGLREAVRERLEAGGCVVRVVADPAAEGYDLEVRRPDGALVLIRCAAGRVAASPAVARDLLGAWAATGARHAVLVAPAGAAPDLVPNPALTVTDLDGVCAVCA